MATNKKKKNKNNNNNQNVKKSKSINNNSENKINQNNSNNINKQKNNEKNIPQVNNKNEKKVANVNKKETKEEEIVFKDSNNIKKISRLKNQQKVKEEIIDKNTSKIEDVKEKDNSNEIKNDNNKISKNKNKKDKIINNVNTEEFLENKKNKKRKLFFIMSTILIVIGIVLCFSTIFAFWGSFKNTIARGVSINGIDVSNLTYMEAKEKMLEVIEVELSQDIELICEDYLYTLDVKDLSYKYNLTQALERANQIGKNGNIIENNFALIKAAIFGENIVMESTYDEESLDAIIDIIDINVPGRVKQYSYYIEDTNLIINPGIDGIHIENEKLKNLIITNIQNREYNMILENYKEVVINIPYNNVNADKIDMAKVAEAVYTEPQNAYYVEETENTDFEIYPAKDGISLAISNEEAQKLIDSEEKDEYIIPITITKAEIQLKDIGVEAFPYRIETFSTRYDASNYSRSKNLQIAASKINGTVLMPGEIFSFNNVVGERTVSEGYENAAIYSNGQVVNGLAGGICQISSTLYNVVLLSNLEIVERFNHSFTTSYVAAGRDATVVYGIKDFKFKNTRNYPIKIEASVSAGVVTFSIYGIKEENEYTVKILPKITQTTPYTTKNIVDPSLVPGTTKLSQGGMNGCKVTTYKEKYLNGTLISSEVISNDVYQVMTRIVRVGPTIDITQSGNTNLQ